MEDKEAKERGLLTDEVLVHLNIIKQKLKLL
jgi:hypothetical protein